MKPMALRVVLTVATLALGACRSGADLPDPAGVRTKITHNTAASVRSASSAKASTPMSERSSSSDTDGSAAQSSADRCGGRIDLTNGQSVERSGDVVGQPWCEYTVTLRQGQQVSGTLRDKSSSLELVVFSPVRAPLHDGMSFTAPHDGDYALRVLAPRTFAAVGNEPKPFELTLIVK